MTIKGAALREVMGRRIRAARRALDLSQGDLAAAYGKTDSWIGAIEAGRAFAPPYLIWSLKTATGHSYGYFFGEGPELPTASEQPARA